MCNSLGGDLAVIHNEKLMNVTIEHTHEDEQDSWIGLKKDEQGDGENVTYCKKKHFTCTDFRGIEILYLFGFFLTTYSLFTISSNH